MATGLGPTRPGLPAGTPFPASPFEEVNSPVKVTVNGNAAEVLNKIGWPGATDTYKVDIRVPDGTAPGMAPVDCRVCSGARGESAGAVEPLDGRKRPGTSFDGYKVMGTS